MGVNPVQQTKVIKDRICQKYELLLLCKKKRLAQIPVWIRHDPEYCHVIYLTAFRADRLVSKERYMSDLSFLEAEILLTEDPQIKEYLQGIYCDMQNNLNLFDTHDPKCFH